MRVADLWFFLAQKRGRLVGCGEWKRNYRKKKSGYLDPSPRTIIDITMACNMPMYRYLPSRIQLVFPSPTKPGLQIHLYEPNVFWHSASLWQSFIKSLWHSSLSVKKKTALKHKNSLMFYVRRLYIKSDAEQNSSISVAWKWNILMLKNFHYSYMKWENT